MTYIGCGVMFLYWKMYRGFLCSKVLMVRVLVLVIASDSPAHYVEMQKVWIRRCRTTEGSPDRRCTTFGGVRRVADRQHADWCTAEGGVRRCIAEGDVRCTASVETSLEPGSKKLCTDVWKMRPLGTHLSNCLSRRDIDIWFVKAKPERLWVGDIANDGPLSDTVEFDRDAMTIYVKGEETYIPGILNKTVEAIRAIGLEYDFVWRTNLSSVLDFDGLLRYCRCLNPLPLGGPVASLKDGPVASQNLRCVFYAGYTGLADVATNKDIDSNIRFASGSGFLLSREAVQYLIENEALLRRDLIDDVAIGALLEPRFGIVHLDRCRIKTGEENVVSVVSCGVFHFRCETYCHERTVEFMNKVDRELLS